MWKFLENYFTFTRREKNGILFLIAATLIVFLSAEAYTFFKPVKHTDNSQYEAEIKDFQKQIDKPAAPASAPNHDSAKIANVPIVPAIPAKHKTSRGTEFEFDPNTIGIKEWMQLGFSEKQAMVIEHYKERGGVFRKPEDIKKLYVMSDENYERLLPYVRIVKQPRKSHKEE